MSNITAEVKKNGKEQVLVITMPFSEAGGPSESGKTTVHASSRGNQATSVLVNGKPLVIGVNAYTK